MDLIEATNYYLVEGTEPIDLVNSKWRDLFFTDTPDPKMLKDLGSFLQANKNDPFVTIRLYHGTDADHPIDKDGLKATRASTAKSLQSAHGYVYLSVYPSMAKTFGEMAYPRKQISVYAVDVPLTKLLPDKDQLKNKRHFAGIETKGTLLDSLVVGHGARLKGDAPKYMITKIE